MVNKMWYDFILQTSTYLRLLCWRQLLLWRHVEGSTHGLLRLCWRREEGGREGGREGEIECVCVLYKHH